LWGNQIRKSCRGSNKPHDKTWLSIKPHINKLSLSPIKSISALSAPKGNNTISAITLIVVTEMCGKILMHAKMCEVKFKMVWGIDL
jgi:hypothetical protein